MARKPSGDYRYPDGSVYVCGPTQFITERDSGDWPMFSPGPKLQYDLPVGTPNDMLNQPAFTIYPPMATHPPGADQGALVDFYRNGAPRNDLPTFFRPANRASLSNSGDQGGHIESKHLLVVPPARYNALFRTPFTPKNVKDRGNYGGVRSRVPGISLGG